MEPVVITAKDFYLIRRPRRDALAAHPVWKPYEEPSDMAEIISWGVDGSAVQRALEEFEGFAEGYVHPLYPVLAESAAAGSTSLFIAAELTLSNGRVVPGYTVGLHAFGIFIGDTDEVFNHNLPDDWRDAAERIGREYCGGASPFPATFVRAIKTEDIPRSGEIGK
jgi:hypothetical protein